MNRTTHKISVEPDGSTTCFTTAVEHNVQSTTTVATHPSLAAALHATGATRQEADTDITVSVDGLEVHDVEQMIESYVLLRDPRGRAAEHLRTAAVAVAEALELLEADDCPASGADLPDLDRLGAALAQAALDIDTEVVAEYEGGQ